MQCIEVMGSTLLTLIATDILGPAAFCKRPAGVFDWALFIRSRSGGHQVPTVSGKNRTSEIPRHRWHCLPYILNLRWDALLLIVQHLRTRNRYTNLCHDTTTTMQWQDNIDLKVLFIRDCLNRILTWRLYWLRSCREELGAFLSDSLPPILCIDSSIDWEPPLGEYKPNDIIPSMVCMDGL